MTATLLDTSKGIVEYSYKGVGPTILLLKGGQSSRETDFSHSSLIYEGFSLLTISRPGYDYTEIRTGKTPEDFADTIVEILDHLHIENASVIAISAAGPTGLALAVNYPERISKLIMEAAQTSASLEKSKLKRFSAPVERVVWGSLRKLVKLFPDLAMKKLLYELTTENVDEYLERLSPNDRRFIYDLLATSQPQKGFTREHDQSINEIKSVGTPILGMYSQKDKRIQYTNALLLKSLAPECEIYEVDADSHLIWIGKNAHQVWEKRLEFLTQ